MNQHHQHEHHGGHDHGHAKKGWKPHADWRFWAVIAMLVAMVVYLMSDDEAASPVGDGERVPAAP